MICKYTAHKFCKDDITKIENYELAIADTEETWSCHHRLELTLDGEFAHTAEELNRLNMYYNRPYFELIFLKASEHHSLHNTARPRQWYIDAGKKTSISKKGKTPWNKGKQWSEETKQKISISNTGKTHKLSEETKKKMSESAKGKNTWIKGKHWKLINGKRTYFK